jgi:NADPH-dependent 2,4-dienoyl-CoA reductase/sulfur reductase-like enzyme
MVTLDNRVLIIGASAAGASTAVQLRKNGYQGEVILAGDESHLPYDRPPLSKQMLVAGWDQTQLALFEPTLYDELGITLRLGLRATSLDVPSSTVTFDDGSIIKFEDLVISTGVDAVRLHAAEGIRGVQYLRTIEDSTAFRDRLGEPGRLVVVGAGFIGLEAAAAAVKVGWKVTVIEAAATPLALKVGDYVGEHVRRIHEARGVEFRTGTIASEFQAENGCLTGVVLEGGELLPADVALIGVGTRPNTAWLDGSGLEAHRGVVTDSYLRAAPHIYAAGDVASIPSPRTGIHARIEHRTAAADQALTVARNILGENIEHQEYPFFWSDQFEFKLQMLGSMKPDALLDVVIEEEHRLVVVFHTDGQIDAVFGCNAPKQLVPLRRALINGTPYTPSMQSA